MRTMAVALDRNLFLTYYSSFSYSGCCCCCSKVLRRHMAHRPSTSFMSVLYNLAKWLFLYSVYFSSLFFSFFSIFSFCFFGPQALFFSRICFFALQLFFFHQYIHNYLQ